MAVKVTVGDHEVTYTALETTAPESYDGFGSFTIEASADRRLVAVPTDVLEWQRGRYLSGLYRCATPALYGDDALRAALIERLCQGNGADGDDRGGR